MADIVGTRCDTELAATAREVELTNRARGAGRSDTLRAKNDPQPFKVAVANVENTTVRRFYLVGAAGKGEAYVPEMARPSGAST
jgi:hypothetical protein